MSLAAEFHLLDRQLQSSPVAFGRGRQRGR
jgi:hypothetical protein